MSKLAAVIGATCLVLLGGCGNPAPEEANANNAATAAPQDDSQARMAALTPGQREEVLFQAIKDAGRDCPNVERTVQQAPVKDAPAWKITCTNKREWIVIVGKSGVAVVTSEAELRANGLLPNASS
jgi:hypothetical protein